MGDRALSRIISQRGLILGVQGAIFYLLWRVPTERSSRQSLGPLSRLVCLFISDVDIVHHQSPAQKIPKQGKCIPSNSIVINKMNETLNNCLEMIDMPENQRPYRMWRK